MKPTSTFLTLLLLLSTLSFYSCRKEQVAAPVSEAPHYKPDPVLYRKLLSYGIRPEDIVETKNHYSVEGDMLFRKFLTDTVLLDNFFAAGNERSARERLDSTFAGAQYITGSLVTTQRVENLRVFVDQSLAGTGWPDAVPLALKAWANVPDCKLNFTHVEYSQAYATGNDIVIKADTEGAVPLFSVAQAEFPRLGVAGPTILINMNYGSLSPGQILWFAVHELGHCLGLKHTDTGNSNSPWRLVPGTPESDPNSVMNSISNYQSFTTFSPYDMVAIRYLYPYKQLDKWITYPEGKYGSDPLYPRAGYAVNTDAINIKWNKDLVNTSTVRLELYKNDVLMHVIAESAPNTGSYFAELGPYLDMVGTEYAFFVQIKIVSNADPAYYDLTSKFMIYVP